MDEYFIRKATNTLAIDNLVKRAFERPVGKKDIKLTMGEIV